MFQIDYDRADNILWIKVAGFWTAETVSAFAREMGPKVQAANAIRADFDALVDSPDFPVQANDVADLLAAVMQGGMAVSSGRAAVVVGSQLNRLQAERTLVHPRLRVFMTVPEARAWLADERASADDRVDQRG